MKYVSTRGGSPASTFEEVVLRGLAPDGGLYVPEEWPRVSFGGMGDGGPPAYEEIALRVMRPYVGGALDDAELGAIIDAAYRAFQPAGVAPMKAIGNDEWLMELFHGPTLAFKDVALQVLGRLFDHLLGRRGERVTIIGATSGDTGSAAIEACRDRDAIEIFVLHPEGRVSDVQRRMMTTVTSPNVHNIAVRGTFDDCQALVKAMFNDGSFRRRFRLSAVNSINWARVMAQIVYYAAATLAWGAASRPLAVTVPTGNFGNVFAGYAARRMGLPIRQLVVGSNSNDIVTRFFESGTMETGPVLRTLSPSMDIQVSSNFERLLFDLLDADGDRVARLLDDFCETGRFSLDADRLAAARQVFDAARVDDEATRATMRQVFEETGELVDPHTAVGITAGRARRRDAGIPMVYLATAHPAKFPDAVEAATGVVPALPPRFTDLFERDERCRSLANDRTEVMEYVSGRLEERKAA